MYLSANNCSPRAFVGWSKKIVVGTGDAVNQAHVKFLMKFYELWQINYPGTNRGYTLKEALDGAYKFSNPGAEPITYGCPDLPFK